MSECMTFPDTVEEFMDSYKIVDTEQVYTNGTEMVPIYRMRQWFQHEPEIIRCKDCKHFHQGEPYSMCYRTPYPYIVDGDKDYCSFVDDGSSCGDGEKKKGSCDRDCKTKRQGNYAGQIRNYNAGRWVETELIDKFPYTQKVDWITRDMCVVDRLFDKSVILTDLRCGIEWETFDGGFVLRCRRELDAPIRIALCFDKVDDAGGDT